MGYQRSGLKAVMSKVASTPARNFDFAESLLSGLKD